MALGNNGIKLGFGDHQQLRMDAVVNNSLNSPNMGQATDLTKQYVIGILSLREAAMGMNRVLTGSARASESQIKALQATLPGFEPDSKTALQRLQSFGQNVGVSQSRVFPVCLLFRSMSVEVHNRPNHPFRQ